MRLLFSLFFVLAVAPMSVSATEEPAHQILMQDGRFEIRQYDPMIVAEVEITGDMRRAGNSGFRPLADFIFGNNTSRSEIDMTAPVTRVRSEKIAMTAPVTRVESDDDIWTVSFVMPREWSMETLPTPNNPNVTIREVPSELMAAVRFSGIGRESRFKQYESALADWLNTQGYAVAGPTRFAGYDAPYVPGPFRRNEVMVPVIARSEMD